MNIILTIIIGLVIAFCIFMFIGMGNQYKDCEKQGLIGIQEGNGITCVRGN